jgi:integrase/recombinase XerD
VTWKNEYSSKLLKETLMNRTNPQKKAKEIAKLLRNERPDYNYLKAVFRHLRTELDVTVVTKTKSLPDIPTEDELKRYYETVWTGQNTQDLIIIKTLLYTGARVSELVNIQLADVDFKRCQMRIEFGKGGKDRIVPFPESFKEILSMHVKDMKVSGATHLFESSWKKRYTDRGIRKILQKYATAAGIEKTISPHKLRHFLFTWLKKQGLDDAMIQPYSGHATRQSLEIYSRMSLAVAQEEYDQAIKKFPV